MRFITKTIEHQQLSDINESLDFGTCFILTEVCFSFHTSISISFSQAIDISFILIKPFIGSDTSEYPDIFNDAKPDLANLSSSSQDYIIYIPWDFKRTSKQYSLVCVVNFRLILRGFVGWNYYLTPHSRSTTQLLKDVNTVAQMVIEKIGFFHSGRKPYANVLREQRYVFRQTRLLNHF